MGKTSFAATLDRYETVGVDSMVFIYHVEGNPSFLPLTRILFKRIEAGSNQAVCSVLSLMEVLTVPYRKGRNDLAVLYRGLLSEYPHLNLWPFNRETAELAAALRARHDISTPDAIQIATAMEHGAAAFITNDKQLSKIKDLDILLLDAYL